MSDRLPITGSCHCGHVTYRALVDPSTVSICHCTDCQVLTGSAFRVTVTTSRRDLTLTGAEPSVYLTIGESGGRRHQAFCPTCGSPVWVTGDADDPEVGLRWGNIRERERLVPMAAIWCSSEVPWLDDVTGLPGAPRE